MIFLYFFLFVKWMHFFFYIITYNVVIVDLLYMRAEKFYFRAFFSAILKIVWASLVYFDSG